MNKISLLALLCLLLHCETKAQNTIRLSALEITKARDCTTAQTVNVQKDYLLEEGPQGIGDMLEIDGNSPKSLHWVEKEHNSLWLKFRLKDAESLSFDIIPKDTLKADYDFLLFKGNDSFCTTLKEQLALRSNISRNNSAIASKTGLSSTAKEPYVQSGPGEDYSQELQNPENGIYYLYIDNVYGHKEAVLVDFKAPIKKVYKTISGKVLSQEDQKGMKANVILSKKGTEEVIATTTSDSTTGTYTLTIPVNDLPLGNKKYSMTYRADSSFFVQKDIVLTDTTSLELNTTTLERIAKGKRLKVLTINFLGGRDVYYPEGESTVGEIYQMLRDNPTLKLLIEGHTNGCPQGVLEAQDLSNRRTYRIKSRLVQKGIKAERIESKGFGCNNMLYPNPLSEMEQKLNRRVEILITDF